MCVCVRVCLLLAFCHSNSILFAADINILLAKQSDIYLRLGYISISVAWLQRKLIQMGSYSRFGQLFFYSESLKLTAFVIDDADKA